jgi:hypothetical protein
MKKLEEYIENSKIINEDSSPFSECELRSILDNCEAESSEFTNSLLKRNKLMTSSIFIGAAISLVVALSSSWRSDDKPNSSDKTPKLKTETMALADSTSPQSYDKARNSNVENEYINRNEDVRIEYFELSEAEAKKIGIEVKDSMISLDAIGSMKYDNRARGVNGQLFENFEYAVGEENTYKFRYNHPLTGLKYKDYQSRYVRQESEPDIKATYSLYRNGEKEINLNISPIKVSSFLIKNRQTIEGINSDLFNGLYALTGEELNELNKSIIQKIVQKSETNIQSNRIKRYVVGEKLVAVVIRKLIGDYETYTIIWYAKNAELYQRINRTPTVPTYKSWNILEFKKNIDEDEYMTEKYMPKWEVPDSTIKSIKGVELSYLEAKELGIQVSDQEVSFNYQIRKDSKNINNEESSYLKQKHLDYKDQELLITQKASMNHFVLKSKSIERVSLFDTNKVSFCLPFASTWISIFNFYNPEICNLDGCVTIKSWSENKSPLIWNKNFDKIPVGYGVRGELLSNINKAIAIKINFVDKKYNNRIESSENTDLYLWYILNKDLIAKLPLRYQDKLSKELELIEKVEKGEISPGSACDEMNSESYLNLCALKSGIIEFANLYPNPAHNESIIDFILYEDRSVSIELCDINGSVVKNLEKSQKYRIGKNSTTINFKDIQPGIYMLQIKTNQNEVISRKIIIE